MRLTSAKQIKQLSQRHQQNIAKQGGLTPVKKATVKTRIIKDPITDLNYCPFPALDPFVSLHQALDKRFGAYAMGGEHLAEVILPNSTTRYRFDHVLLKSKVLIEADGFGSHRTKAAFIRDRNKQAFCLEQGYVLLRVTNKQVRDGLDKIIESIEKIIEHRTVYSMPLIKRVGKTWYEIMDEDESYVQRKVY